MLNLSEEYKRKQRYVGSDYQVEPSRATLNDPPYRDLPRPPALMRVLGIHQVTVAFHSSLSSSLKYSISNGQNILLLRSTFLQQVPNISNFLNSLTGHLFGSVTKIHIAEL